MNKPQERPPANSAGMLRKLLLITSGGVLLVTLLTLIGLWRTGTRFFAGLETMFNPSGPTAEVDIPTIVVRLRNASELTTAIFAMQAVVPTSQDRQVGKWVVGKTKLLYIAYGEVRAGVDLSQLNAEDIQVNGDTLRIQIPPAQILDRKIDVNRSRVYDYDRGFLDLGPDVAPDLQTLAAQTALNKMVAAACTEGVLTRASDRAQEVITQLLNSAGYEKIVVKTQPPATDACQAAPPPTTHHAFAPTVS